MVPPLALKSEKVGFGVGFLQEYRGGITVKSEPLSIKNSSFELLSRRNKRLDGAGRVGCAVATVPLFSFPRT